MRLFSKSCPSTLTVEVDSREKYPFLFPETFKMKDRFTHRTRVIKVKVVKKALKSGDYRLAEFPNDVIIERKSGRRELHSNISSRDSRRQGRAFVRLKKACRYPVLVIEAKPGDFIEDDVVTGSGMLMTQNLCRVLAQQDFTVMFLPGNKRIKTRRALGLFLLHYMVAYALYGARSD